MIKIISIILAIALGTFLHFSYELSGCNKIVGLFSATNESTWEHLKLSFFPILLISILEFIFLKGDINNFITSKMIAAVFAMLFTVVFFYTYTGIIGKNYAVIDISTFVVSVILAELVSYKIMELSDLNLEGYSLIILILIIMMFVFFTIKPPEIQLFKDPITKTFGSVCKK